MSDNITGAGTFNQIIEAWDNEVQCSWPTKAGTCKRQASWVINLHGCDSGTACTQHYRAWLQVQAARDLDGGGPCPICKRMYRTLDSYHTAVRL